MKLVAITLLIATAAAGSSSRFPSITGGSRQPSHLLCDEEKDFAKLATAIKSAIAPKFVYLEDGRTLTFNQMMDGMKMGLPRMGTLTMVNAKILSLKEMGFKATITAAHTIKARTAGPDKKMHTIVMTGTSTDSYIKHGSKWEMTKMDWKNGAMTMDGKPMDMSKMGG